MSPIVVRTIFQDQFIDNIDTNHELSPIDMGYTEYWPTLGSNSEGSNSEII